MEKINYHDHEPDWIDGLLAITDSARRILLALKRSRSIGTSMTLEEFARVNNLETSCESRGARREIEPLGDYHARRILEAIVERGNRPYKGRPLSFSDFIPLRVVNFREEIRH